MSDGIRGLPDGLNEEITLFRSIGVSGFMVGLNIGLRGPEFFLSEYPQSWQREYEERNHFLLDPMFGWGLASTGTHRWSDMAQGKGDVVFERARAHGLNYGAVVAVVVGTRRSILSLGRGDREVAGYELTRAHASLLAVAAAVHDGELSAVEIETLRLAAEGLAQREIALQLHVAEPTVKIRLARAKDKLRARNTTHAVAIAQKARLF